METPSAQVRVVEQAVEVLFAIAQGNHPGGIRGFAEQLGISKTTLQRILGSLQRAGVITPDPHGQSYAITSRALLLADSFQRNSDLISVMRPSMESLREMSDETVTLAVEADGYRVTIFQLASPRELRMTAQLGKRYPLIVGAGGRVLLSTLGDLRRREILAMYQQQEFVRPDGQRVSVDPERIEQQIRDIRVKGFEVSHGEWDPASIGISVPIVTPGGDVAALSIYGVAGRLDEARIFELTTEMKRLSELHSWYHPSSRHSDPQSPETA